MTVQSCICILYMFSIHKVKVWFKHCMFTDSKKYTTCLSIQYLMMYYNRYQVYNIFEKLLLLLYCVNTTFHHLGEHLLWLLVKKLLIY